MPKFSIEMPIKLMTGIVHLADDEVHHVAELIERGALKLIEEITPTTDAPATDAPATDVPATDAPATDDTGATDKKTTKAKA
ncbi:MAG: hypothetical protein ACYC3A_05725 [Halothiobacillus sp.]